jgi:putative membrane protein
MENVNEGYQFGGMHFFWWFAWCVLLFWIFASPYKLPGQRLKRDEPLDILKKRLAKGDIDDKAFQEKKKLILEK